MDAGRGAGGGRRAAVADTPTVDEMDRYVAGKMAEDLQLLRTLKPAEIWVAPDGRPSNSGAEDSPVDLQTACTSPTLVKPGTVVWIGGGQYNCGAEGLIPAGICGTREKPIIFRAVPGVRATINGMICAGKGCDHLWWWGVEITGPVGSGVATREVAEGLKFINLFIHGKRPVQPPTKHEPSAMGIEGWDKGNDHEFYGNVVFDNGWNNLDHGFYTQNTAAHTAKRYVDNIVFENSGQCFQIYGSAPIIRNIYVEGNIAFCGAPPVRGMNILIGGEKNPTSCVIVRSNCTYNATGDAKRSVDLGYHSGPNTQFRILDNYFIGGQNALEMKQMGEAVVRGNTFWAPRGMVVLAASGPDARMVFEGNRFVGNGTFDIEEFRRHSGTAQTDRMIEGENGRPMGLHLFKRVNRYEPERVHLAVYNWSKAEPVALDLSDVLKKGEKFRIMEVHDLWAKPALQGVYQGGPVDFSVSGDYAPEFGCYVLFRDRREP